MSKQVHHEHGHHEHHAPHGGNRKIHHDWRFWAVILMLIGMGIYVATNDESLLPGGQEQAPVPEAAE